MAVENTQNYWDQRLKEKGFKTTASSRFLRERLDELQSQGYSEEKAQGIIEQEVAEQESNLAKRLIEVITGILGEKNEKLSARPHLAEVSVGPGHLANRLVPTADKYQYHYCGVDFSYRALEVTRNSLARWHNAGGSFICADATNLPFTDASLRFVIWGRLGLHLVKDYEWLRGLTEVKRVLEPGGCFLLYESLVDGNPQYEENQRKVDTPTYFRYEADYVAALQPMLMLDSSMWQYCDETYSIILWREPIR